MFLVRSHTIFVVVFGLTMLTPQQIWSQGDAVEAPVGFDKISLEGRVINRSHRSGRTLPEPHKEIYLHEIYTPFFESDVYAECWDNDRFLYCSDVELAWPIHIAFNDSSYAAPINRPMVVTSRYGWRAGKAHHGIDIDLITGDLVMALLPGKVRLVKYVSGMGKTVVVRHENGLETIYGHLSKQFVNENDYVKKGQALGRGGTTGNARGSHLHLEVRYKGKSINPEYLFDFKEKGKILAEERSVSKYWATPRKHRSTRKSKLPKTSDLVVASGKSKPKTVVTTNGQVRQAAIEASEKVQAESIKSKPPEVSPKPKYRIPVLEAPDLGNDKIYVVQSGDTLFSIAKRYRVPVAEICEKNKIGNNFLIKVGQALQLGD